MPWQEDRGISGSRRTRSAARDGAGATLASIAGVTITREGRYSLPKDRLGTPRNATEALATPSRQPASLHGLRVSSPLEADSDRLLAGLLCPLTVKTASQARHNHVASARSVVTTRPATPHCLARRYASLKSGLPDRNDLRAGAPLRDLARGSPRRNGGWTATSCGPPCPIRRSRRWS